MIEQKEVQSGGSEPGSPVDSEDQEKGLPAAAVIPNANAEASAPPSRPAGPEYRPSKPAEPEYRPSKPAEPEYRPSKPAEPEYPPQKIVNIVMFANFLTMFLVSLDRMIVATAIPTITNHFHSLSDVGWYGSAYLITTCGFQLSMGRLYTFYDTKWLFLASIGVFELGSLICGVAPNSVSLIVGRAIAGLGACGIFSGGIVLIVDAIPLHKRPLYMSMFGAVFGISSVAGPLLGGAFTSKLSWRWCFYINLPCGGFAAAIILLLLKLPAKPPQAKLPLREKINRLDPIGTIIFLPPIVCLLIALQNGGTAWAWSSARVIVLLVLSGVGIIAFIGVQIWRQENATVPPRIFTHCRTIPAAFVYSFCSDGSMQPLTYFLAIWFQAIRGASAVKSGIMSTPLLLAVVISNLMAGFLTKKFGYYIPSMYFTSVMGPVGAGLITTFSPTTNHSKWIGYQVIYGLGMGAGMMQSSIACQTVLDKKDVPTGISLMFFARTLAGAVFISVANNIFDNKLGSGIAAAHLPNLSADTVTKVGATELRGVIPSQYLPRILAIYNSALRSAFYVSLGTSCAILLSVFFIEWKSVRAGVPKEGQGTAANPEKETVQVTKQQ
ncbi:hypothetical protein DV735_g1722, partial [Chaetothyriales sp. CBS 134920]